MFLSMYQLNYCVSNLPLDNSSVDLYIIHVSQITVSYMSGCFLTVKTVWKIHLFQFFNGCIYSFTQLVFTEFSGKRKQIKQT